MVQIRRMGPQIGVEVTGVDVKTLDAAGFAPIYQAWLDNNVLVVRDQELEIEDFLRYSRRFGNVVPQLFEAALMSDATASAMPVATPSSGERAPQPGH